MYKYIFELVGARSRVAVELCATPLFLPLSHYDNAYICNPSRFEGDNHGKTSRASVPMRKCFVANFRTADRERPFDLLVYFENFNPKLRTIQSSRSMVLHADPRVTFPTRSENAKAQNRLIVMYIEYEFS